MTLLDLTARACGNAASTPCPSRSSAPARSGWPPPPTCVERGIDFVDLRGRRRGRPRACAQWGHTRLFSPWKHLVDPASRRLLEAQGWQLPDPERAPTGTELVEKYVAPLAAARADRLAHPHPGRGRRRHPRGHGPHPHRAARSHARSCSVRAPPTGDRGGHRPRGDRRLGHLPIPELALVGRARAARDGRDRRPGQPRAARRARPRPRRCSPAGTPPSSAPGTRPRTRCSGSCELAGRSPGPR